MQTYVVCDDEKRMIYHDPTNPNLTFEDVLTRYKQSRSHEFPRRTLSPCNLAYNRIQGPIGAEMEKTLFRYHAINKLSAMKTYKRAEQLSVSLDFMESEWKRLERKQVIVGKLKHGANIINVHIGGQPFEVKYKGATVAYVSFSVMDRCLNVTKAASVTDSITVHRATGDTVDVTTSPQVFGSTDTLHVDTERYTYAPTDRAALAAEAGPLLTGDPLTKMRMVIVNQPLGVYHCHRNSVRDSSGDVSTYIDASVPKDDCLRFTANAVDGPLIQRLQHASHHPKIIRNQKDIALNVNEIVPVWPNDRIEAVAPCFASC